MDARRCQMLLDRASAAMAICVISQDGLGVAHILHDKRESLFRCRDGGIGDLGHLLLSR